MEAFRFSFFFLLAALFVTRFIYLYFYACIFSFVNVVFAFMLDFLFYKGEYRFLH